MLLLVLHVKQVSTPSMLAPPSAVLAPQDTSSQVLTPPSVTSVRRERSSPSRVRAAVWAVHWVIISRLPGAPAALHAPPVSFRPNLVVYAVQHARGVRITPRQAKPVPMTA